MPDLLYVGYGWTDDYIICEDCKIDQRVPTGREAPQVGKLPNYHQVMKLHQDAGHRCYVRTKRQKWPPELDRTATFRIVLRQAGVENEMDYCA
jgi:hypothetical protein